MKISKAFFDFNKEIFFGELGALICIPLFSELMAQFTSRATFISFSAILGALIGGSTFWLAMRVYDKERKRKYSLGGLVEDIAYFTPAAFVLGLIIYQPVLFFVSHHLLVLGDKVLFSVLVSQASAFLLFLISINVYRSLLYKFVGEKL